MILCRLWTGSRNYGRLLSLNLLIQLMCITNLWAMTKIHWKKFWIHRLVITGWPTWFFFWNSFFMKSTSFCTGSVYQRRTWFANCSKGNGTNRPCKFRSSVLNPLCCTVDLQIQQLEYFIQLNHVHPWYLQFFISCAFGCCLVYCIFFSKLHGFELVLYHFFLMNEKQLSGVFR